MAAPDPPSPEDVGRPPGDLRRLPVAAVEVVGADHRVRAATDAVRGPVGRDVLGLPLRESVPGPAGVLLAGLLDDVRATGRARTLVGVPVRLPDPAGGLRAVVLDLTVAPRPADGGAPDALAVVALDVTAGEPLRPARAAAVPPAAGPDVPGAAAQVQRALLPERLPVLPGAVVAARYLPAAGDAAGGDWFDVVALTDGAVALVVGDVVGHGVVAAAAMGEVRAVVSTVLLETGDLRRALAWADRVAVRCPSIAAATMVAAVLDPATGLLRYATCGHPAPLLLRADGTGRPLPASGGGPLGTGAATAVQETTVGDDDVLVLHTDGLVVRPGRTPAEGTAALLAAAGEAVRSVGGDAAAPERVCRVAVDDLAHEGLHDDVTVLAARRIAPVAPWRVEGTADVAVVARVRASLLDWLRRLALGPSDEREVELAVGELVANVVEHAYPPGAPGPVRVVGDLGGDGTLTVRVTDEGVWHEPTGPQETTGRGLWLAGALAEGLHVERGAAGPAGGPGRRGTTVTLRHRPSHPAVTAPTPAGASARPRGDELATELDAGPPRVLRVRGPVDLATAGELAGRLDAASRGGTRPLVVDLTGVALLASAGVRLLLRARAAAAVHGLPLGLTAAEGSAAHQVLDLVGLAHDVVAVPQGSHGGGPRP